MRIIGGEFRGRRLLGPEGAGTRPITDRVKQSLFDILKSDVPGARVYDCFAGTGSLGLEALSRGAARVSFFESDRSAVARLRRNVAALGVSERCRIVAGDLFKRFGADPAVAGWRAAPEDEMPGEGSATLVFLDPPYRLVRQRPEALCGLAERLAAGHLAPDALVVFRHDAGDALDLPGLIRADQRRYGGMTIEFFRPAEPGVRGVADK